MSDWPIPDGCTCPRADKDEPYLHGVRMGWKGQRLTVDPNCPVHEGSSDE